MYLMDSIVETAAMMRANGSHQPLLAVYPHIAERLSGAPRYLLDDDATRTAVELSLGRPRVLLEAIRRIRIPYPRMWIEWSDAARQKLRETFDEVPTDPLRPLPDRIGFLIEAEERGRRGVVTWAWTGPASLTVPNIGAINAYFDLDRKRAQSSPERASFLRGNLAKLWEDNPPQLSALLDIWGTAEHRPSEWGNSYLSELTRRMGEIALAHAMADVYGEYIMVWSILLLLTSSRRILDYHMVNLERLNKARIKKHAPPRLDHTRVSLYLGGELARQTSAPLGHARKSPRVHMVSSYLARRADKHWIVAPYWRGSGETIHRRVMVKG